LRAGPQKPPTLAKKEQLGSQQLLACHLLGLWRMAGRSKVRARGVTYFEAKVGVLVVALVGSGAAYAYGQAHADESDQKSAEAAGRVLKAAERYFEDSGSGWPTITSLRRDDYRESDVSGSDAWSR